MQSIGIVGLGLMGTAIAARLSGAGFGLVGHDVDGAKRAAFAASGRDAASLAEVVAQCDTLVLAVFDTAQVEAVTEGAGGIAPACAAQGRAVTVLCTSTCDPDRIERLAARCSERAIAFIELPISGTSLQVARGEGVGLIAGDAATVARVRPLIDAICPRSHALGACGNGGRAKLAVNLVLGLNRGALAEGIAFAERAGLDPAEFFAVVRESAAYSAVMDTKGASMVARKFDAPQSRVDQSLKDFRLMLDYAARHGQELPFANVYAELMADCVERGEGQWDNAAIAESLRRRRA
jgi:putative dehydrogenase